MGNRGRSKRLTTDFAHGKIANASSMVSQKMMYLVVNQPSQGRFERRLHVFYWYSIG